jgi:hypothetical protein
MSVWEDPEYDRPNNKRFCRLSSFTESEKIMNFDINLTNICIVMLDLLLVWACFSVDSHLKCIEAEDDQYHLRNKDSDYLGGQHAKSDMHY